MKKVDRRVRKTKKAIQDGLADLMLTKDLRNITVQELSDKADVHRATFYSHYTDVYDLYSQMEDNAINEIIEIVCCDPSQAYDDVFSVIIGYVYDNAKMCRLFLDKKRSMGFADRLSAILESRLEQWLIENKGDDHAEKWKYYASYHVQGCLAIVNCWAMHDFTHSKEGIIKIISQVDSYFDGVVHPANR